MAPEWDEGSDRADGYSPADDEDAAHERWREDTKAQPPADVHRSSCGHLSQAIIRAVEPIIGHLCPRPHNDPICAERRPAAERPPAAPIGG
jgi:hypothetical protein